MANSIIKPCVYTTQKLSKNRVAVYRDGRYIAQLLPKEVAGWIARVQQFEAQEMLFQAEDAEKLRRLSVEQTEAKNLKQQINGVQTSFGF